MTSRTYSTNAERQRAYRQRRKLAQRNAQALQQRKVPITVERPPIRYYGGKWRIGSWIAAQFPPHRCYVEPFAGGASVLLQKTPSWLEVINDLNNEVITFFDVLRSRPAELIRAISLTPYAREELHRAMAPVPSADELERARRFYIRCWQSFGSGVGKSSTGWRYQVGRDGNDRRANVVDSWNRTDHLWECAERLKMVQIEHDDASRVIERFDAPTTLFYVDPPYVHSTRYHNSSKKGYAFEMNDDAHRRMADLLKSARGMVVLSGYPSSLYDDLYAGWHRMDREARDINGGKQIECLWLSPSATDLRRLPLFAQVSE